MVASIFSFLFGCFLLTVGLVMYQKKERGLGFHLMVIGAVILAMLFVTFLFGGTI